MAQEPYVLEVRGVHKQFPGVYALNHVNLQLRKGEVHALLGENGAGKSTLINVLGGIHTPDQGEFFVDGQPVDLSSVQKSQELGIAIIHQELVLVPYMTVAENIFLGREPKTSVGTINKKQMNQDAQELIASVGLNLKATTPVYRLSVAQQQMVEIAKALSLNARVLIMDEPTSSLTDNEVVILFQIVNRLKKQGVGIIYVSHRMSELFEITDRITVLRDGQYIDTKVTAQTNSDELVYLMVGRELTHYYTHTQHSLGSVRLEAKNISQKGVLHHVSFSVRAGEIIGFSGLVGAGRSELMRAIMGLDPADSGSIAIDGKELGMLSNTETEKHGLVMVPENRKLQGLILKNTVSFNTTLAVLNKFMKFGYVNHKKEVNIVHTQVKNLSIKTPSIKQNVGNLSGGNQQKVLFGKWLATDPKILILDEPTRGVDVGAKADIYEIIDQLASQGIAVIMVSSELNEVINMCDRILVMAGGRITGELNRDEFSQERIMHYATNLEGEGVS